MSGRSYWDNNKYDYRRSDSRDKEKDRDYRRDREERSDYKRDRHDSHRKRDRHSNQDYCDKHRYRGGKYRESSSGSSYTSSPSSSNTLFSNQHISNHHPYSNHSQYKTSPQFNSESSRLESRRTSDPRVANVAHQTQKEEKKQNFRILIDPTIKKGHTKIVRYDGVLAGQPPVVPKDPRRLKSKIWTLEVCDLPVPDLKMDKNYVGAMAQNIVRFSGFDDHVDRKFLFELCESYGDIKEYKVYFDPKTNQHTGTGKVIFDEKTNTKKVVDSLNGRLIMGKPICAWIDVKHPPGHTMWIQVQKECLKFRADQLSAFNLSNFSKVPVMSKSIQEATPRTPKVGSLQRSHPMASYKEHISLSSKRKVPPPPPLKLKRKSSSPHAAKYEDISPTTIYEPFPPKNGKHVSQIELIKKHSPFASPSCTTKHFRTYSPVSNPNSPQISILKDELGERRRIFQNLSPSGSVQSKSKYSDKNDDDDDNMSLSSISSNEENKVELNVKREPSNSQLPDAVFPFNNSNTTGAYPSVNYQLPAVPPFPPPVFPNAPIVPGMPPAQLTLPPPLPVASFSQTHTEIIQNALKTSSTALNNVLNPATTANLQDTFPCVLLSVIPPLNQSALPPPPLTAKVLPPPIPPELAFAFQVKSGCARDLSMELKRVLLKDTLKKLVEQSAFQAFESWWNKHVQGSASILTELSNEQKDVNKTRIVQDKAPIESIPQPTKELNTASVLLKTLFGYDKNNENQPPNFLNSFRISRKPHLQPLLSKSNLQNNRKHSSWSSIRRQNTKVQRLEESEDEQSISEDDYVDDDDDEFEQLALQQRKVNKSGSSLYQKIYSDESDEEKSETNETQSEEDNTVVSSESSEEISSSSSSESESEVEEEDEGQDEKLDEEKKAVVSKSKKFEKTEEDLDTSLFRSMYDEPRRRKPILKVPERKGDQESKPKPQKVARKTARKKPATPPVETSSTETGEESTHEADVALSMKVGEEMLRDLVWLEHNYFMPTMLPSPTFATHRPPPKKILRKKLPSLAEDAQVFKMRTMEEELNVVWNAVRCGIDNEDMLYMKEAFDTLNQVESTEVKGLCWEEQSPTICSPQRSKRGDLRVNQSGSARSEGFYRISMVEKAQYLKSALRQLNAKQQADIQARGDGQAGSEHKIKSRQKRAMQRRLTSSIAQEEFGSLINYNNKLLMRKKALRFAKSSIHNWGLFACEPIAADEMVCEYVGQMVRAIVAELRERRYEKQGIGSSYLFRLDMDSVIDATKNGCNARFINHSCEPNCYAKVILVEGAKKIVIYSRRVIKIGEEITYDYKFPIEEDKIPCSCGASLCRGSLN